MQNRKGLATSTLGCLLAGAVGLIHLMEQARFQNYHNADVLQLIGSGMCFGVAVSGLLALMGKANTS